MVTSERRKNTRVAFKTTVDVRFQGGSFAECEIKDLSVKGFFVFGVRGRKKGDPCELKLCLSGASSELCLQMKGEVVRVLDQGVGVAFLEIDLDSFYHLKNIVYYNAEDPDLIDEELVG